MAPYLKKPLPIISLRVEWSPEPPSPLPDISMRREFDDHDFKLKTAIHPRVVVNDDAQSTIRRARTPVAANTFDDENQPTSPKLGHRRAKTPAKASKRKTTPPRDAHDSGEDEVINEDNEEEGEENVDLIEKPLGEPGRPNSGGYSFEDVMMNTYQWSKTLLDDVQVSVQPAIALMS